MRARRWAATAPLLLLAACVGAPRRSAPVTARPPTALPPPAAIERIPDAVPRDEPRSALGNPPFYEVDGRRYLVLASAAGYVERGVASWYGTQFHGLRTATGESYDMFAMTAAHKTLPLPCYARVTNLANGRSVVVRINDRGPFVANRIIDLSYTAAVKLDMIRSGTAFVQVQTLTSQTQPTDPLPLSTQAASAAGVGVSSVPAIPAGTPLPQDPDSAQATTSATATPASPPATQAPAPDGSLYIQVGAFAQAANASRVTQTLRQAGLRSIFTLVSDSRHPLQRVRIGPIASVQQYDQLIARLQALGFSGARLAQD